MVFSHASHHTLCLQVRRLLSSAEPTTVRIGNAPEVGDPEMQALQQARLLALGMRTMTLPLGRGALTLGAFSIVSLHMLFLPCMLGFVVFSNIVTLWCTRQDKWDVLVCHSLPLRLAGSPQSGSMHQFTHGLFRPVTYQNTRVS